MTAPVPIAAPVVPGAEAARQRAAAKVRSPSGLEADAGARGGSSASARRAASASALTAAGLLALWTVAAWLEWTPPLFLPGPDRVLGALWSAATQGFADATLAEHVAASLARVLAALALALPAGVAVGALAALSPVGRGVVDPLLELLRPLPPLAYLPLVVIWFGVGEFSKALVIALAMTPPIAISTALGVRGAAPDRIDAARALGASRAQVLWFVIAPSALPSILAGVRIALGAGWSTLVAAELVAASEGLGFMIQSAAQFLVTEVVLAGILAIAAVAIALEALARLIERRLAPWAGRL